MEVTFEDAIDGAVALILAAPLAIAYFAAVVLLATTPSRQQNGIWAHPLGTKEWVPSNVRLIGLLALFLYLIYHGFRTAVGLDGRDGEAVGAGEKISITFLAFTYWMVGIRGFRNSKNYLSSDERSSSRTRMAIEILLFIMHCLILVVAFHLSATRVSWVLQADSARAPNGFAPASWYENATPKKRDQVWKACKSGTQWCSSPEWYLLCLEFLPDDTEVNPACPPHAWEPPSSTGDGLLGH